MVRARKTPPTSPGTASSMRQATGQPYGQNKNLQDALSAIPATGQPAPTGNPTAAPGPSNAVEVARNYTPPQVGLGNPSARPGEMVTSGINDPSLMQAPSVGPDPDLDALRAYLPALEKLANLPTSTVATRNLIRRLRGAVQ